MTTQKKKDDELPILVGVNGLFLAVLGLMNLFYSDFQIMPGIVKVLVYITEIAGVVLFFYSIIQWKDPNKDWTRKVTLLLLVLACIAIGGYKVYSNENKQVIIDSEKAKQEQRP